MVSPEQAQRVEVLARILPGNLFVIGGLPLAAVTAR